MSAKSACQHVLLKASGGIELCLILGEAWSFCFPLVISVVDGLSDFCPPWDCDHTSAPILCHSTVVVASRGY